MDNCGMNVGHLIAARRKNLNLTQPELSERCGWGFNPGRISHYEKEIREPKLADLETIAKALETTLEALLFGDSHNRGERFIAATEGLPDEYVDRLIETVAKTPRSSG